MLVTDRQEASGATRAIDGPRDATTTAAEADVAPAGISIAGPVADPPGKASGDRAAVSVVTTIGARAVMTVVPAVFGGAMTIGAQLAVRTVVPVDSGRTTMTVAGRGDSGGVTMTAARVDLAAETRTAAVANFGVVATTAAPAGTDVVRASGGPAVSVVIVMIAVAADTGATRAVPPAPATIAAAASDAVVTIAEPVVPAAVNADRGAGSAQKAVRVRTRRAARTPRSSATGGSAGAVAKAGGSVTRQGPGVRTNPHCPMTSKRAIWTAPYAGIC